MRLWIWMAAVVAASFASGRSGAAPEGGWINLFNGKDMEGWTKVNEGDWSVEGGLLKYGGHGNGWVRTNDRFTDFQLIGEWRYPMAEGNHDSGLFFRAAAEGNPWTNHGYQLNMGPGDNLGSIGGMGDVPAVQGAPAVPMLLNKPGGEWNTWDLIVVGQDATLIVNGRKAWDATGVGIREGGYLGWQCEGAPIEIRSVRLRRLTGSRGAAER